MAEALAALDAVPEAAEKTAAPAVERDARVLRADLLINLGRPGEAAGLLERLAREEPRETRHRVLLGRAYASTGRLREALEVFGKLRAEGAALDGDSRRTWAAALIDSGRPAEALKELAGTLAADPWLEAAYLDLGRALGRLGRAAEAAPFLERYRRGEAARKIEKTALIAEAGGQEANAAYTRGDVELLRGRIFPAMTHFNRALSLDPRHGPAFVALLRLSARIERQEAALARIAPGGRPPEIEAARADWRGGACDGRLENILAPVTSAR